MLRHLLPALALATLLPATPAASLSIFDALESESLQELSTAIAFPFPGITRAAYLQRLRWEAGQELGMRGTDVMELATWIDDLRRAAAQSSGTPPPPPTFAPTPFAPTWSGAVSEAQGTRVVIRFVPEPGSLALLAGAGALVAWRRSRRPA